VRVLLSKAHMIQRVCPLFVTELQIANLCETSHAKMHHEASTPHDYLSLIDILCGSLPACSTVIPGSTIRYDPPNNPDNGSSLRVTQPQWSSLVDDRVVFVPSLRLELIMQ
jgi:hypothetical protein